MPKNKVLEDECKGCRQGLHDEQRQARPDTSQRMETSDVADPESNRAAEDEPRPAGKEQPAAGE